VLHEPTDNVITCSRTYRPWLGVTTQKSARNGTACMMNAYK